MWMNVLWKGPVTTAASTTLAHLFVPATQGTLSIASPTVEVSGLPLYGEAKPGSRATLEGHLPILRQRVYSWTEATREASVKGSVQLAHQLYN